jgi:hypothetical protein
MSKLLLHYTFRKGYADAANELTAWSFDATDQERLAFWDLFIMLNTEQVFKEFCPGMYDIRAKLEQENEELRTLIADGSLHAIVRRGTEGILRDRERHYNWQEYARQYDLYIRALREDYLALRWLLDALPHSRSDKANWQFIETREPDLAAIACSLSAERSVR